MIDIDADLRDADWPKRTPDQLAPSGDRSRAAGKPALALLGPDATDDELDDFVEALTGRREERSTPPWWERLTVARHLPGQHDQQSHAGGKGGAVGAAGTGTGTKDDPIRTNDVEAAQKALAEGKYVELRSERQVSTLVDRLAKDINEARAKGETRDYDLCRVSVPRTNLFCSQNVGIPRAQMPQLKGRPTPGSPADALPKNAKGEADVSAGFVEYLRASQGIGVSESIIDAKYLKASQNQLDGVKVIGMAQAMREGKIPAESIFVTRDDYIVDGHHRWAANVANEYTEGRPIAMPVRVIDTDIITVLSLANQYAADMGLPSQAYGQRSVVRAGCGDCGTSTLVLGLPEAPMRHLAGQHDQQSHAGGISPRLQNTKMPRAGHFETDDPTKMANLPADHQAKIRAKLDEAVPGLDQAKMERNLETVLEKGLANPATAAAGREWYADAHRAATDIATEYGFETEQAIGAIAGSSPQHEWGSNVAVAKYTARCIKEDPEIPDLSARVKKPVRIPGSDPARYKTEEHSFEEWARREIIAKGETPPDKLVGTKLSDHHPTTQAALIKAMGSSGAYGGKVTYDDGGQAKGATWSCGIDGVEKAVRVYRGEDPDAVLAGHKVRSFYNNILDPKGADSVTIDTHAISAAAGTKITADDDRMDIITGAPSLAAYGTKGSYPAIADAYRAVADKYGLTPNQAQAIIWLQWREDNTGD